MASMELPPEPSEKYELWRKDIEVWKKLTETPKVKMGPALQYACRNNERLHEAVLNIPEVEVDGENGIDNVLKVLDKLHHKESKDDNFEYYNDFVSFKREENKSVASFILEFEAKYRIVKSKGNLISDECLAYKLLRSANISMLEERIVKASTSKFTFDNIVDTLKKNLW